MKKRRNPFVAGLLNALVPGSSHLYVSNDWSRFTPIFLGGVALLAAAYLLGNAIQNIRDSSLPLGLCPGIMILAIMTALFFTGMKTANLRNDASDDAAFYQSKRDANPQDEKTKSG